MREYTTVYEAIKEWEEETQIDATTAKEVDLRCLSLPIRIMDRSLGILRNCEKLYLSTNSIEKIENLRPLTKLRILSLGKNQIKSLSGIEAVAETLEELWISYNQIESLYQIEKLKELKVLYISHNEIKLWTEFDKLLSCPKLVELNFLGNPLATDYISKDYRAIIKKRLCNLKILDHEPFIE